MARTFDPRRLDLAAFAAAGAVLSGETLQRDLTRLEAGLMALPGDTLPEPVRWSATGEQRVPSGSPVETWLHLEARTHVTLQCQRCLQPMVEAVLIDRRFRFVAGEDEAARLDEESEDDVLVLSRAFDLPELLEDELILALPLVPRHEACPDPLPTAAGDEAVEEDAKPNPFAVLAALRRPPGGA